MEKPTIEPQDISLFHSLNAEFKALNEKASEAILAARANSQNEITIARGGKPVVLAEGALWDEVWTLGASSEAGGILAEIYPQAFKLSADAEAKKAEMTVLAKTKWNIDPVGMTLSDILRICEAMVEYKLTQEMNSEPEITFDHGPRG